MALWVDDCVDAHADKEQQHESAYRHSKALAPRQVAASSGYLGHEFYYRYIHGSLEQEQIGAMVRRYIRDGSLFRENAAARVGL